MTLVTLVCLVAYLLRTSLSVAAPAVVRSLGITDVQLGLAFAAFSWVYAICQVPAGVACEIAGPRRAYTALVASWGVITLLTGLIPGTSVAPTWLVVAALVATRAALGVTQAVLFPGIQGTVVPRWLPPGRWALATGLTNVGYTLGGAAAGPLIAWLMLALGWRLSFIVTAPIAFGLAIAWWWVVRDDPARHPRVNAAELAVIVREHGAAVRVDWRRDLGGVFVNRDILLLTVSNFLVSYLSGFFYNWIPTYLVEFRHVSIGLAGALTGATWLVASVCAVIGGLLCDWLCARRGARDGCRLIGLIGGLLVAPLMLLGAYANRPAIIITLLALAFGLTLLTDAAYWVAAMRVAGARTAAATGLMNTGANAAIGLGALAMPIIGHRLGWDRAIASGALFAVASAVCWFWIDAERVMTEPVAVPAVLVPAAGSLQS
jgi:ACS family D-galactonate transporter-like MFS transporter